jgi:hypothetical protein
MKLDSDSDDLDICSFSDDEEMADAYDPETGPVPSISYRDTSSSGGGLTIHTRSSWSFGRVTGLPNEGKRRKRKRNQEPNTRSEGFRMDTFGMRLTAWPAVGGPDGEAFFDFEAFDDDPQGFGERAREKARLRFEQFVEEGINYQDLNAVDDAITLSSNCFLSDEEKRTIDRLLEELPLARRGIANFIGYHFVDRAAIQARRLRQTTATAARVYHGTTTSSTSPGTAKT